MAAEDDTSRAEGSGLRLGVVDGEDLAVVSAHLQDAETALGDMAFLPRERRFALVLSRLDWPLALRGRFRRRPTGLHFDGVLKAERRLPQGGPDGVGRLLAITFEPREAPGGEVLLTFAGGAQIKLVVECLQAEMRDIGAPRDVEAPMAARGAGPRR